MKSEQRWVWLLASLGCVIQFLWIQSIPVLARHTLGVIVATAASSIICAYWLMHKNKLRSVPLLWLRIFLVAGVGAVSASVAYWLLEIDLIPKAATNSLEKHTANAVGMTMLLTGGWFVGGLCGLAGFFHRMPPVVRQLN